MFRRIVVGADGTSEGRDAVALGASIATATGAGLTLLQSFPPPLISTTDSSDRRSLARQAEKLLASDRRKFAPTAHTEVAADSNTARALCLNAERWHADLVVIGSSRRAASGRCSIGQTGRGLLDRAPFALAIARRGLHEEDVQLSRIAVGYDGGAESKLALYFADQLATGADAELLIQTVVQERLPSLTYGGFLETEKWDELRELDRLSALALSRDAAAGTTARSQADARIGYPGFLLRELSESVDLMVIGSRRWGVIARVVLGGVGETLASDCGSSLLITCRSLRVPNPPPAREADHEKASS